MLVWRLSGRVCIAVHGIGPPSDDEWNSYLEEVKAYPRVRELLVLIYSLGGGPTSVQRQKLQQQAGKHAPPVAIVANEEARMRGISTALAWFNDKVRAFDESQVNEACAHLGLTADERAEATACIPLLKSRVSVAKTGTR